MDLGFEARMAEFALKLRYFPARSRGESIRMLLKHSKIPFDDILISGPEFGKMKADLPCGQLPILEVKGKNYPESGSILRFVGRIAGSTPNDPVQLLAADAAYEVGRGLVMIDPIVNMFDGDRMKETYNSYYEKLPHKLNCLADLLGDSAFYGGDQACYADFGVWHYLDNTETVKPGSVMPQKLRDWMERVASLPEVAAYLAERPPIREERVRKIEALRV